MTGRQGDSERKGAHEEMPEEDLITIGQDAIIEERNSSAFVQS